ncbi:MFS transporter [Bacillus cereus]|uniref:Multidrug resistance protein possible tetracycline resistance determinant n=1 Tax=Bacillus thuringiensis subsp. konkukian (strain 97-27) TaxID=281309 RepID=Q6HK46_BACHK|nr:MULTISPECIES: MFS transporter [Bacillus]AAT59635.1 multidrug resistance protein; possible tetracycline resistance determinant [[Bacillus thuringiensis] serovar konkukian str. 97-27]MCC0769062.1 MFS transporter [Bacillus pacificus]MCU5326586.1 MFS transporter [Bacillus cereus]MCU5382878.1 MFS transporter [Bacillus cereus]MCU5715103.1 MFS transporter [Bacillus cereus]
MYNQVGGLEENSTSSIWSNKIFSYFFLASCISLIGNSMVTLVLPLWVMKLTNSPLLVSGVNVAIATAAILFAPVTGTLADRMSRRKLMIIADVMRCIVMILIAVIAFYNKMLYIPLLILLIIRSIGSALFTPASNAALVTYVEEKHVQQAITLRQISIQIISVAIPLMASFLISLFNFHGVFVLDAITFFISFLILMNIKFPRELKIEKKKPFYEDFKEGFSIFNSNQSLKTLLMSAAVINLLGAACMLSLQVIVVREMDLSTRWYSIVFVASPIGILIGAFITKKIRTYKTITTAFIFTAIMGIFNAAMGTTVNPVLFSVYYFLSGIAFGVSNVYFGVLYRKLIPNEVQGRFFGFLSSLLLVSTPVGIALTGYFLESISASIVFIIIGIITFLVSVISFVMINKK